LTSDELRGLIETQGVERKRSLAERTAGLKALNAMVNAGSASGCVLFGVGPDGSVVGVPGDVDAAQRSLTQHIHAKFSPPISVQIFAVECDGRWVLVLQGERLPGVSLCEYDGRAFIREGSEMRLLALSEKLALIRRRDRDQHPGPWRCDRCGSMAMQVLSAVYDGEWFTRSYECECGGEWWPAT
jgi:predicted HTH transcriptional regulator